MGRYISILLILLGCGCTDVINVEPENSTTYTNYFKEIKDAEALLTTLQVNVRSVLLFSALEPHMAVGAIMDSTQIPNDEWARELNYRRYGDVQWVNYYTAIHSADMILDNLHRFPLTEDELKPYELQAYFAKGVMYFLLAQRWGEVPITKGTTYFGKLAKSNVNEVLEEATKWALKALELPAYEDLVDGYGDRRQTKQYGSKGAAAALLAHIYAWRASIEDKDEFWGEAEKYCSMIIDGDAGYYQLAATPELVCTDVLMGNSDESIWEIYRSTTEALEYSAYYGIAFVGYPVRTESMYDPNSTYSYYFNEIFRSTVQEMYDKDDLRRSSYFLGTLTDTIYNLRRDGKTIYSDFKIKNDTEISHVILGEKVYRAFVYKFRKSFYIDDDNTTQGPRYRGIEGNKVVWRLADIVLLRAECRAHQNKSNAIDDLNMVRKRAYGNNLHDYNASEGNLLLTIFKEREKELIFEDHRYYDVIRNGKAYVRTQLPTAFRLLTDSEINDGALYYPTDKGAFTNNDVMRQNNYWFKIMQ